MCALPDDDSEFDKIGDELWNDIETEFGQLSPDAQGIFASATYDHGAEELNTKENVADRYDYILSKYSKKDFMCRIAADTYVNNFSARSIIANFENSSTSTIIVIISITSFTLIAGLILFAKRKYQ